jgi:hypothetical protein
MRETLNRHHSSCNVAEKVVYHSQAGYTLESGSQNRRPALAQYALLNIKVTTNADIVRVAQPFAQSLTILTAEGQ